MFIGCLTEWLFSVMGVAGAIWKVQDGLVFFKAEGLEHIVLSTGFQVIFILA